MGLRPGKSRQKKKTKEKTLRRHLLFFTKNQEKLLRKAKVIYIDGTFKLVGGLFYQLYTLHAFIRDGDSTKQVVLAFVIMMGKNRSDHYHVSIKL